MKSFEKESFLKSFLLFFLTIELLIGFLIYHSYNEDVDKLKQQLFLEMKNYNFTFEGDRFDIDFVPVVPGSRQLELQENAQELYTLFPLPSNGKLLLKVYYERPKFDAERAAIAATYGRYAFFISIVVLLIAFGFAHYTLRPLRRAVALLDQFIKDIIHDLNTPVSAIRINTAMLPRDNKAVQRIEKSAETIGMLYSNLQSYLNELPTQKTALRVEERVRERVDFFRGLYPALRFRVSLSPLTVTLNPDALERILDNLLSNACKYNIRHGEVDIVLEGKTLRIANDSHGIRHTEKLFQRFYKESERGIGIGLHIVRKLCDEEGIDVAVTQEGQRVLFTLRFA